TTDACKVEHNVEALKVTRLNVPHVERKDLQTFLASHVQNRIEAIHEIVQQSDLMPQLEKPLHEQGALVSGSSRDKCVYHALFIGLLCDSWPQVRAPVCRKS